MTDFDISTKPERPCHICGSDWYWPGDYYWGRKQWICGGCHPPPPPYVIVGNAAVQIGE